MYLYKIADTIPYDPVSGRATRQGKSHLGDDGIISGFGHSRVRHPDRDTLLLSRSRSLAFVMEEDILEVTVDGE